MTVIGLEARACPVCDEVSEQPVISSTSAFGAADLDTRPPELARSNLAFELQLCPACGYAWHDESAEDGGHGVNAAIRVFVRGVRYQAARRMGRPELARAYRCRALLDERKGELALAGWSMLRAAWACDNAHADGAASECRLRAVELWRLARARVERFAVDPGGEEAIMWDALRRAGDFDAALAECDRGARTAGAGTVRAVLEFERELISAGDRGAHSVAELQSDP